MIFRRISFFLIVFCLSVVVLPFANAENESEKIDINSADAWTLELLHGVGKKKAAAIIKFREENGLFKSIQELDNVYGIGKKTILKNKDRMIAVIPEPEDDPEDDPEQQQSETDGSQTEAENQPKETASSSDNAAKTSPTPEKTSQPTDE